MTEDKIKVLIAKLRKRVPKRGEWTSLAEAACGEAADALESLMTKPVASGWRKHDRLSNMPHHSDNNLRVIGFVVPVSEKWPMACIQEQLAEIIEPQAGAPTFDARQISLKQNGEKIILTLELDGIEPASNYTVTPVNPAVVRTKPLFAKPQETAPQKFYAPKGWRMVPEKMSASMINAWSGGTAVSCDEVAYRTPWQESWKRLLDAAMDLKCVECYDTGYIADGNHCMACSEPASADVIELLRQRDIAIDALHRIDAGENIRREMKKDDGNPIQLIAAAYKGAVRIAREALAKLEGIGSPIFLSQDVIDHCWKMYQKGRGSADHTDKDVFTEVLQSLTKCFAENPKQDPIYQCREHIHAAGDIWSDCSKDAHDHMAKYPACFATRTVYMEKK